MANSNCLRLGFRYRIPIARITNLLLVDLIVIIGRIVDLVRAPSARVTRSLVTVHCQNQIINLELGLIELLDVFE